jgi:YozD-like protein
VREVEVIIDTDEIAEFFFQELLKRGYAPIEGELDDLADITFEYLIEKCIIDEEIRDDTFIDENE